MFREMRRIKQQVSREACVKVLNEGKRATFAVNGDDGYPFALPIDYLYVEEENRIYFHGARSGYKVDAIKKNDKVCFMTMDEGFKKEGRWEWNVTSVIIYGRARLIDDREQSIAYVRRLAEKFYPSREEIEQEIAESIDHMQLYAIDIEHMTGKLVNER